MSHSIFNIYKKPYISMLFYIILSPCPVSYHSSLGFMFICPYVPNALSIWAYEHKLSYGLLCHRW